jgi:hypothetical protein
VNIKIVPVGIQNKEFSMKANRFFVFGLPVILLALGLVFVSCGDEDEWGDGSGMGCRSLSAGTECSEQSVCSNRFLCKTGQGDDDNCSSCSCQ